MASLCVQGWPGRLCFFIYYAAIEHRAVDIDDYFDPKIINFDHVFIASLSSFLLEIILGHLIIFPIYFICSLLKRKVRESPRENCELSAFCKFLGLFMGLCLYSDEWCSHGVL